MNRIYYIVSSGCNSRHLHDVKVFDKLKDTKPHIKKLTAAYKLTRHEELFKYPTEDDILITTLKEVVK